ncbi:hypothetical protein QJS04_geneDACA015689 [Acorus gramineus]|uniref:Uncharacterized protein n=1 Tax=Acorus gramineus TaxID=55184 RepID=A0AAV9ALM2_ACOGR|nr:hypothetical protein QJS04_geneDACA015689 [Acorus gramineus]
MEIHSTFTRLSKKRVSYQKSRSPRKTCKMVNESINVNHDPEQMNSESGVITIQTRSLKITKISILNQSKAKKDVAANGLRIEDYTRALAHMRGYSEQAAKWVEDSNPNQWANALFSGERYGEMYSNYLYSQAYVIAILPVVGGQRTEGEEVDIIIKPPLTKIRSGRKKKNRIESQADPDGVTLYRCSRCKGFRHNRKTCKNHVA